MNYSSSGAITHTGGAQRRTGGAADAKYSVKVIKDENTVTMRCEGLFDIVS